MPLTLLKHHLIRCPFLSRCGRFLENVALLTEQGCDMMTMLLQRVSQDLVEKPQIIQVIAACTDIFLAIT
jgi:hypothetical protein